MNAKSDMDDTVVVNTVAIAKMFNLTPRRVRQLVEEGVVDRIGHGRFNLIDTVSKYITFLKLNTESLTEGDVTESLDYEKWLHEKAKREKAEIELAHIKKEMHSSGEVEEVMNNMMMNFRQRMLAIPSVCAPFLVNRTEPKYIETILEQNVNEALNELSEYDPSMFVDDVEDTVEVEDIADG
ncbi:hypothetical protein [Lysinibacillus fusiformis]|uniref:hypothetical protein n=1 Tax=Lysinibacillus fusiformis TaxID=28031 RepID=UPI001EF71F0C|nr:hypothetical protein [Lysinibacillus fusiformis]MCG7435554.1 hypothetical protein [Lysinibacillus fusiformis]